MITHKETGAEASVGELQRELSHHYGLVAASFCGLPKSLLAKAESLLPLIDVKTIRCNGKCGEISRCM